MLLKQQRGFGMNITAYCRVAANHKGLVVRSILAEGAIQKLRTLLVSGVFYFLYS